jgi:hypothetical protein
MRRFYPFWFLFCAIWGYMSGKFPAGTLHVTVGDMPGVLFGSAVSNFLLVVLALRLSRSSSDTGVRFGIDLKPWDDPLGVFQFVLVTFIFVGVWGILFSLLLPQANRSFALLALGLGAGGLTGGLAGTRLSRRIS